MTLEKDDLVKSIKDFDQKIQKIAYEDFKTFERINMVFKKERKAANTLPNEEDRKKARKKAVNNFFINMQKNDRKFAEKMRTLTKNKA